MKRIGTLPVETPVGTFHVGYWEALNDKGPGAYAETESGDVTINNVTYHGTVYYERTYRGDLYLSTRHLTRWDGRHFQPATESAGRKLDSWLRPFVEDMLADDAALTAHKVGSLKSSMRYALMEANRSIEKANEYATQIRALGTNVEDIERLNEEVL